MTRSIEIFDGRGQLLPLHQIEPQLADANAQTRERFEALRRAALGSERARDETKAAQQRMTECAAAVIEAECELRRLRPPIDPVTAARMVINTHRQREAVSGSLRVRPRCPASGRRGHQREPK